MAEWLRSGLQSRLHRFDSGRRLLASKRQVQLTPYRDGPLLVRGPAAILDADGIELVTRRQTIALCRCGKSRLRPFCDGTHKRVGFRAAGVPGSAPDGVAELEQLGLKLHARSSVDQSLSKVRVVDR